MKSDPINFEALDTWLQEQGQNALSNAQRLLLQACLQSERVTYEQFAAEHNYSASYVRCGVAKELWRVLRAAAGERVTKSNCYSILTRLPLALPAPTVPPASVESQPDSDRLDYPNGAVPINSRFYIPRLPIENRCKRAILQPCTLLRLKAPHTMGKSSLLSQLLAHAQSQGCITIRVNFQAADTQVLSDLSRTLRWLCVQISQALELPSKLDQHWNEDLGYKMSCSLYMKKYLLPQVKQPFVLALDEVSVLFNYPDTSQEFFTMLRTWHEYTKVETAWQHLRLVLVQSTDSYVQLNVNQSPFNVGLGMSLTAFSLAEVEKLVALHPLDLTAEHLTDLHTYVAGHPYLIRLALYHLTRQDLTFEALLTTASGHNSVFRYHLQYLLWLLQEQPELMSAMQQVLASAEPISLPQILGFKLRSTGLVQLVGNQVQVSCPLYRDYLEEAIA
ncbi:MAG: hypothetical protein F6J87_05075 [Spirulina sp. SIO3F2]|nr:hypothetical protein [Spirulina sp. SIO3F2]